MTDTPVAMIVFRRPDLAKEVLKSVRSAGIRKLYVIGDGPREQVPEDLANVQETRDLFENLDWECEVTRIYSDVNLGLRTRVLTGLDEVFRTESRAIILEDDCVPHIDFFKFADTLLDYHDNEPRVGLVSANNFAPNPNLTFSYYFSTYANIWGWATWARTWHAFREASPQFPLSKSSKRILRQQLPGMLRARSFLRLVDLAPKLDSWAIQFALTCATEGWMSAVPKVNLARNIGFGQESTHTKFESFVDEVDTQGLPLPLVHPTDVAPDFREMRRESRVKLSRWFSFPVSHPLDTLGRFWRGAKLIIKKAQQ